jgi:beta-glucuronidase
MRLNIIVVIFVFFNSSISWSQEALLSNVYNRNTISLDGEWSYIVDPYENGYYNYRYEAFDESENPGRAAFFLNSKALDASDLIEYDFDKSDKLNVPGDWNTQRENLYYYEGTIWYKRSFDFEKSNKTNRVYVYFGACNYQADVYLNGKKLGRHEGGFTPFNFEITENLKEKDNFLIVKVDNKRKKEGVPTLNTDWWNYGGLTRSVKLVETPENYIRDHFIQLNPEDSERIVGKIQLSGKNIDGKKIEIKIKDLDIDLEVESDQNGQVLFSVRSAHISYWSPGNPRLYEIEIKTAHEVLKDQIGFRTIRTKGSKILLNGNQVFLKGICIHEESPITNGRANSKQDAEKLLGWAEELGCNFVRLAHYPHNEEMVRLADRKGIMVWAETPVYWTIQWENSETYKNAEAQLSAVIYRDRNRASVIIWSMANETPVSEARNLFLTKLSETTRKLDPTRLISAALEQGNYEGNPNIRTITDPFADQVDVLSFNQYIGWYDGLPDKCKRVGWKIAQDKPVLISEFGAGAKFGMHGDKMDRWTEEYQAYLYEETLEMLDGIEQLQGISPWILRDFRSPRRPLPGIQDGWNRKGLISDKSEKKQAFNILQKYYETK